MSKRVRKRIPPTALARIARRHLLYEVTMLIATAHALRGPLPRQHHDALLESFLIHARAVDEFLYGGRRRQFPGGAYAVDYAETWPGNGFLTKKQRENVNVQLAHLSALRVIRFPWNPEAILGRATTTLDRFLSVVAKSSPETRGWFDDIAVALRT